MVDTVLCMTQAVLRLRYRANGTGAIMLPDTRRNTAHSESVCGEVIVARSAIMTPEQWLKHLIERKKCLLVSDDIGMEDGCNVKQEVLFEGIGLYIASRIHYDTVISSVKPS